MTLVITECSAVAEPVGGGVAQQVCQTMEQDGWIPGGGA